ncbi:glycosyltransferase family 4 protein [Seonamhaeicola sp. ML3]|uniref:glycosyltransferase family 4 protein n=1 Tax=Seonamhaeicola sp. ML3 TaxID=2937786 RepID=UPI0020100C66|nr:glycosyltransferase family 4 protein [Seonamhaeicola sp. ML3]
MTQRIAVICNYELLEDRVGGMDYFFWVFDKKCKENNIDVRWFFPNYSNHGRYSDFHIVASGSDVSFEISVINKIENTYDLVFTHFVELCTSFYCKLKEKTGAKIVAIDHNPRPLRGYPLKKKLKKRIKGFLYSKCIDQFIGVSQYTATEVLKDFGNHLNSKTSVIYNGIIINQIRFNSNRKEKFPKFVVASHLRESKGVQDLIEAVKGLPDFVRDKLIIDLYGEGPYEDELKAKVNLLSLNNVFTFKGSVSNLNEIYHQYDYMLQPTHMECFSLSILESLAANVPVITTNVGGNEEVVTNNENGYIFEPRDTKKLREIIEAIFLGEIGIKTNTRTLIESKYSIDLMVVNYMKLLA